MLNTKNIQGFHYFNSTEQPSLMMAIKEGRLVRTETSLFIKDRKSSQYFMFNSYEDFARAYPEDKEQSLDEIILPEPQKLKYDIDDCTPEQFEIIKQTIGDWLFVRSGLYDELVQLAVCDSSGYSVEKGRHKYSYHIIAPNMKVSNVNAVGLSNIIHKHLPDDCRAVFDCAVNKLGVSHFRTPLSHKEGRVKAVPVGMTRRDCMITTGLNLPIIDLGFSAKCTAKTALQVNSNKIIDKISSMSDLLRGWTYRSTVGSNIHFKRTPAAATYCPICERDHTRDNTLYIQCTETAVYHACIKSKQNIVIYYMKKTPRMERAINRKVRVVALELGQATTFVENNRYLSDVYECDTVLIRAPMGSGKTESILRDIKKGNHRNILWLSSRVSYTHEIMSKLRPLDFLSYLATAEELECPPDRWRRVYQMESLYKLDTTIPIDLVIIDEIESCVEQFSSPTMRWQRECFAAFEHVVRNSRCIIGMDGNLSKRAADVIANIRGRPWHLHVNEYKTTDRYFITGKPTASEEKIRTALRNGKNIVIATDCKKFADTIHVIICTIVGKEGALLITSDTIEDEKRKIFADVNQEWKKYRAVIYTPTVNAGISFTEKHFNLQFGYFTQMSCSHYSQLQMLKRVRHISEQQYYICYKADSRPKAMSMAELRAFYERTDFMREPCEDLRHLFITRIGGKNTFQPQQLFDIIIYNEFYIRQTRSHGLERFCDAVKASGATLEPMEAARKNFISCYELAGFNVLADQYQAIIDSADIAAYQFEELSYKSTTTEVEKIK